MSDNSKSLIRVLDAAKNLRAVMDDYFSRLKRADETREKKIAWCTSVGPQELLYAMGFEVYCPENHAAMLGASKTADRYIPVAVAHGYSPDICSYLTSDIGSFLKEETPLQKYGMARVPRPDVLVYNTNQCADVRHWFAFYAHRFQVPLLGIHTPLQVHDLTAETIEYVSRQYQQLALDLASVTRHKLDPDRFREAVKNSREACVLWRQVLETARHRPAPINFFDASIHMGPVVIMRGTCYPIDYYRTLLGELRNRISRNIGAIPQENYRLYWEGMPLWFKLSSMAGLFAGMNCCMVASTYCNSWVFDDLDPDDPFTSSALAYTKLFIVRSDDVKQEILANLLQEYGVQGIIYHDAKTCPRNSNTRYGLPQRLKEQCKIPFLELQGDLNDARCFSAEQSNMAIETFVEQLAMGAG